MARFEKASKSYNEETGDVRFEFANGNSLTINVSEVIDSIKNQVIAHGLLQKIGDSYAGAESVEEAYESAAETLEMVKKGEWRAARTGVGLGSGDLAKALAVVTSKTEDECRAVIAGLDADQKKGLRKHPAIGAELAKMQAAKLLAKAAKASTEEASFDLASIM